MAEASVSVPPGLAGESEAWDDSAGWEDPPEVPRRRPFRPSQEARARADASRSALPATIDLEPTEASSEAPGLPRTRAGSSTPNPERSTTRDPAAARPQATPQPVPADPATAPVQLRSGVARRSPSRRAATRVPATPAPAAQAPASQRPATQRPATPAPAARAPASQRPATRRPAAQRPATQRAASSGAADARRTTALRTAPTRDERVDGRRTSAARRASARDERARSRSTGARPAANQPRPAPTGEPHTHAARPRSQAGGVPGRRTVTIVGRGSERNLWLAQESRRRPPRRMHERVAFRPDRAAMWAVLLGLVLVLVAATSSHP
jgi:hypothetical protein